MQKTVLNDVRAASRRLAGAVIGAAVGAWLAVAVPMAAGGAPQAQADLARQVDKIFAEYDRPDSPGCAVAVVKDGAIVYENGYGSADIEHDVPVEPGTVFYIGSVSKQFTAMAAALAVQEGKVGLDEDIRRLVPELPDYGRPITVRHLVHHTSGLRDIYSILSAAGRRDQDAFDNDSVLRIVARHKELNFMPGDEHLYSNSGYAVLALVVERATGQAFSDYAETKIFRPLGMTVTHFHDDISRLVNDRAYAYQRGAGGDLRLNNADSERVGAGGVFSSVRDLARWDQNFYDGRVGGTSLIEQMETPGKLNDGKPLTYAWGLTIGAYRGLPIVEHGGSLGGYRAHLIRFREQRFSVVCLCNLASIAPGTLARRVADVFLRDSLQAEAAPGKPVQRPERPVPRKYEASQLGEFAGTYTSDELQATYAVSVDGSALRLRRGFQRQLLSMQPTAADDEFTVPGGTVRFRRDVKGRVEGLTVDAGRARGMRFSRTPLS